MSPAFSGPSYQALGTPAWGNFLGFKHHLFFRKRSVPVKTAPGNDLDTSLTFCHQALLTFRTGETPPRRGEPRAELYKWWVQEEVAGP